ncbi:MAG: hypothetical protein MUC29_08235 [Pyrinomonadaceae bacterium]|jgi:hypothetical protein|nr:hypothetical protein [Pyrinomonadaceae bacterium]
MIKLERIRTKEAITSGLRGKGRKDKALALLNLGYQLNFKFVSDHFNSNHWKKAKPQLAIEANGKCAYCEAPTNTVAHGDVEHFRPKSVYWWLVYCYDNYSYACQICNQTYKGDKFPVPSAAMLVPQNLPSVEPDDVQKANLAHFLFPDPLNDNEGFPFNDFKTACEQEKSFLIDPYLFNPEDFFAWEADEVLQEVKLIPRKNTTENLRIIKEAEECLGLNREELRVLRWQTFSKLELFKLTFEADNIEQDLKNRTKNMLKEMTDSKSIFAGMCRYFVHDIWKLNLD